MLSKFSILILLLTTFCVKLSGKNNNFFLNGINKSFFFKLVSQKKLVCYHTNWSQYRSDNGKFFPENIDANLCTHIIYSFAKISGDRLAPYEWNDEDTDWSRGMYSRMMALKAQNPSLKVLIAVGGWNHGGAPFSIMVHDNGMRSNFVRNSIDFLKKNGFDGLGIFIQNFIIF
jgi:chitinase